MNTFVIVNLVLIKNQKKKKNITLETNLNEN